MSQWSQLCLIPTSLFYLTMGVVVVVVQTPGCYLGNVGRVHKIVGRRKREKGLNIFLEQFT